MQPFQNSAGFCSSLSLHSIFSLFSFLSPLAWLLRKIGKKQDKLVMNFHYEPQRLLFRDLASLLSMS